MNGNALIEDFINGKTAVDIDKENREQIEQFYGIIAPYVQDYPKGYVFEGAESPLCYLKCKYSGPYHFFKSGGLLTGAADVFLRGKDVIPVQRFIDTANYNAKIESEEFLNILVG